MAASLPSPDVYLSERIILCETKLQSDLDANSNSGIAPATVCDVVQLAARKAVGCAVGDGAVEAEPSLVLSPDCKHLAVKEPCSRCICLLSAQDSFKDVVATLVPQQVVHDGEAVADTVLSCSWSADSKLLLVACKSSAVYLYDNVGKLLCHWDTTWSWVQLQLVAACFGHGNTIFLLTAARVVFLVAHNGNKQQRSTSTPGSSTAGADGNSAYSQQQLQYQQQQVLQKYSEAKRYHTSVSAIGYDDKSGLLVIAGDGGGSASRSSSASSIAGGVKAAFAAEGVTVSVWQLQDRQLQHKFHEGSPQGGPGLLASAVAGALGVDRASATAAAATRWSVVFSPLLEYVALLTGAGSVYLLSLTEGCLVDPASGFAGRSVAHGSSSGGGSSAGQSPTERSGLLRPKHISLSPFALDAASALSGTSGCHRAVAWWGPRVLAVAAADGSVSLVRLPESVNILGAAPARFAAGSRVVAVHSGSRGLLVVEPISAALAAAAAGTSASGAAAAAVANSLQVTATEAMFAADASAAVGFSAVLAAKRTLAAAATPEDIAGRGSDAADGRGVGASARTSRTTAWLAKKFGVSRDELQAAAGSSGGSIAGWRLVLLAERTPQQLVQVHLRLKDWGSALRISQAYGLDTDAVYLARWAASPVSRSSIADNLPKIKSRRAVVAECLSRIAPDYESARLLISYGLRETVKGAQPPNSLLAAAAGAAAASAAAGSEFSTPIKGTRPVFGAAAAAAAGPPATPGGLSGPAGPNAPPGLPDATAVPGLDSMPAAKAAEVRWWRLQRLKLLALHDRLETCMALKRGSYDPEMFAVLRTEPLPKATVAFAAAGNVAGLAVLLQRHKSTLAPRLLQLLSALPESLDPRIYASLVPRVSAAGAAAGPQALAAGAPPRVTRPVGIGNLHAKGMRKVDWVENEETFRFLAAAASGGSSALGCLADTQSAAVDGDTGSGSAAFADMDGAPGLQHAASLDGGPGLPIPVPVGGSGDGSRSTSSSSGLRLSSAGSLDITSWAICADEAAVMMHATEEMDRYCSVNGANKRTLPTDPEIASWLSARALQLDATTGQLTDALQLLELAVDKGYGQLLVQLPCRRSSSGGGSSSAAFSRKPSLSLPQESSISPHHTEAAAAVESNHIPLHQLLLQGKVLLQLVKSWWPVDEQQQGANSHRSNSAADQGRAQVAGKTELTADMEAAAAATAVAVAAAAELQPSWSVTLQQWVSAGLLPQLLAVLDGSSRDLLQRDLQERVLPLMQCHPQDECNAALHHLLVYWVARSAASPTANSQPRNSGSSGGGRAGAATSTSGSSSNGIMLAAALLASETELLQTVAAADALSNGQPGANGVVAAISMHQQRQLLTAQAASGELSQRELLWGGDVCALVSAVVAAVKLCSATNQWARIEQLLDAAEAALAAAAAVNGLPMHTQEAAAAERQQRISSSGSSSYGSAAASEQDAGEGQEYEEQQQQPAQDVMHGSSPSKKSPAPQGGWGERWDSEEGDWQDTEQQTAEQQLPAAVLSAVEPLRAALLHHAVSRAELQQLQAQLSALRGQVQAARLLTKHGCSVSIGQVAVADSAAAQEWLKMLLARAERLGSSWPEAQWAQVWHDLLEAQQSGLSIQLPAADLAAAFLRVLLLAHQYHLAVQLLPLYTPQQLQGGQVGTPTGGTPTGAWSTGGLDGVGAFDLAMDAASAHSAGGFGPEQHVGMGARDGDKPASAEAALAALTGGGSGARFPGSSRFGVRRALHNAAGAAVSTAVGGTAKLMGVSAHLVGSTAHLVGNTAQAVQVAGGVVGATAGLVSGTASLVSSAATFAAEAAAKASSKAGLVGKGSVGGSAVLRGALGLLTASEAEAVVVGVSKELLGSAASLDDPAVVAAEAVLQLLPPDCKAAAAQRDSVAVLRRLPEFGVSLLPAQLTSLPDKHQLLQRILFGRHTYAAAAAAVAAGGSSRASGWDGSSVPPWRRLGDVLELAALLGYGSEDEQNEVRLMAAEAALSAGEVGVATHLCLQLAAVRHGPAWHLAAELACPHRYATHRQERAAKVQELVQQEQQVQEQLLSSQHDSDLQEAAVTAALQQQIEAADGASVKLMADDASDDAADAEAVKSAAYQGSEGAADDAGAEAAQAAAAKLQLVADDGDGGGSTASVSTPVTPGAEAAAAAADGSRNSIAAGLEDTGPAAVHDITAADIEGAKQLPADGHDGCLQAPSTPLAAADATDASATVVEAATGRAFQVSNTKLILELPPKDRQKLLAFAACYCPSNELPGLTDDLVLVHHQIAHKEAARQQQKQAGAAKQPQHLLQQVGEHQSAEQALTVLLPLQQPASATFQQQRQQLLHMAIAAAAAGTAGRGRVDPYRGLLCFGDPYALFAVLLLSSSSPIEAQKLLEDAMASQLSGSSSGSREAGGVTSSYCCLQRLLVVGAAAQLLLLLQPLPQGTLVEVAASAPISRASCDNLKLPHHQELLLQLLHVPLGQLQASAMLLLQQQRLPAPEAADAVAAAAGYVSRLQQMSHGRQLLQWLPGVEAGRFFAGDKPYQEQVLIQLASKAGQMAVQPTPQQEQPAAAAADMVAAAEALMAQAQQLAASYGADPFQLELWFVHSLVLYAPDLTQPEAQALLASHAQQLMQQPAAAAAHLFYHTYPLLPAAAAGHCSCVLGLIHAALQAFSTQQQEAAAGASSEGSAGGAGAAAVSGSSGQAAAVPTAVASVLPQLDKLKDLLVKSSKALSGISAKALIGGHVALMVGPAVAAAAAMSAQPAAETKSGTAAGDLEAASAAAAAAVAAVDLPMLLLEASSAVSAFVATPAQAGIVAKFIRHINTLAEMHARASVGDKPKQQMLQKLAQGVSPGLPHLLLLMKTLSSSNGSGHQQQQQQQQCWVDAEERLEGLTRTSSAESFQSAVSVTSSLSGANAHSGHNPAAALAIEWATARARYASSSGRQQLLNCSALQLSGLAGWLVLSQQQPVLEEAVGQLQPLAMGPGLQLQVLSDVISLVTNPEAQLQGLTGSAGRISSGGSSRSSSFQHSGSATEQAAATAVAAAAALAAGSAPAGALTPLMRDDPAAIMAWRPPNLPANLAVKRRELVTPLLRAAARIVAKHIVASSTAAAAAGSAASAVDPFVDEVAAVVSQTPGGSTKPEEQQQQVAESASVSDSEPVQNLLRSLILGGSFSAVAALQLVQQLSALQWALDRSTSSEQQIAAGGGGSSGGGAAPVVSEPEADAWAEQQAAKAVARVVQQLAETSLQELQQQVTAEAGGAEVEQPAVSTDPLIGLQLLIGCLRQDAIDKASALPAAASGSVLASAAQDDTADSAATQQQEQATAVDSTSSSWLTDGVQQLRGQLWQQLQQHQAQMPAEAYSNRLVAELLELQETISSGAAWPGWGSAAGAAAGGADGGGSKPKSSGTGLLLARTMTALSKQFPGLKASADDLASVDAAVGLFSALVAQNTPLAPVQCAALTTLLTDVWKEGAALPQSVAAEADAAAGDATGSAVSAAADSESVGAAEQQQEQRQEQEQEQLAASVGLPVGSCQVSVLHSCWRQLLGAMLSAGYVQDVLMLLDKVAAAMAEVACSASSSGHAASTQQGQQPPVQQQQQQTVMLPLQEAEAVELAAAAGASLGAAGQAVVGLLLPYRSCQQAVMDQLLQGRLLVCSTEPWAGQLLLLLLLRGQLPQLAAAATAAGQGEVVPAGSDQLPKRQGAAVDGERVQQQQLYHMYSLLLQPVVAAPPESSGLAWAFLTCLFPHAVAQLCLDSDYAAAAALVAAKVRTCGRLCTFNGGVLLLQRYLEVTMQRPWQQPSQLGAGSPLWLPRCEAWLAASGAAVAATAHTRLMMANSTSEMRQA